MNHLSPGRRMVTGFLAIGSGYQARQLPSHSIITVSRVGEKHKLAWTVLTPVILSGSAKSIAGWVPIQKLLARSVAA